ncbi:MAG: DUF697 domain-containing protein [Pirellulaceae bacterium]
MQLGKTFSGLLLLVAAAIVGLALLYLPGWIIDKYEVVSQFGSFWGWAYLIAVGAGGLLFAGSLLTITWRLWRAGRVKQKTRERHSKNPSELSIGAQNAEINENINQLRKLRDRGLSDPKLQAQLDPMLEEVEHKREQQTLEIVAFGTISSGKSSVLNLLAGKNIFATDARGGTTITRNEIPWDGIDRVVLVDTPGLGEVDGEKHVWIAADSAKDADIVLMVVDGPLRDSEFKLLEKLGKMEKRVIICLNKSDWYHVEDRDKLLGQLQRQTKHWVAESEVIAIQSQASKRVRKRVSPDGTTTDEEVEIKPDISSLADCMMRVVKNEGKELLMANVLMQSRGMVEKAKLRVKESIDRKVWDLVDRYMWGAGAAAATPLPIVDLVAGFGISTKMILDLADVYEQKVDLQTARKWLGEMAKILVGVLGSQATTATVGVAAGTLISTMLKTTVPIAGTLVGNALQGAIQALITRWIGSVFIEYFGNEMKYVDGGLANIARRQWETVTTQDELKKLVVQARQKLMGSKSK